MRLSILYRRGAGLLSLAAALLLAGPGRAQTAQEPFGRVRVQYKKLNWQEFTTQNFNVYYYDGGEASARRAAEYAEQELLRITNLVGYFPYSKTTLMLYNSINDLRQSNIGLPVPNATSGGEANLARQTRVEIAFAGRETDFKRDLSYQLTQVLLNDMLYGGTLREVLQSNYLLQLPDWFVAGASAYAAEGWSVEMDGYMRDQVRAHPDGNRAAPFFARNPRLAGHSIFNYIAERYGYGAVQNVLNLTRITRDVETGVSSGTNLPYRVFLRNWLGYYRDINLGASLEARQQPTEANRLSGANRRGLEVYSQPAFSPDGRRVAYVVNEQGHYRVVVADGATGRRRRTLLTGGHRTPDQAVETRLPVLAWRDNQQLAVGEFRRGLMRLRLLDAAGGGLSLGGRLRETLRLRQPTTLFAPFDQVLDLSYSPDGKMLVFSAVQNGQNDLYLLRAGARQVERLTNDLYDDQQPVFLPDGGGLVFSSNRYLDSAGRTRPATFQTVVNNYDLYLYHLDGRAQPLEALVNTISNETRPRVLSADELLYLSEESGVRGLYRLSLRTRQHGAVSNFSPNVQNFDYSPAGGGALAFVSATQARDLLYLYPQFPLPATDLTLGKTARQQILERRSQPAAPAKAAAPARAADRPATGAATLADSAATAAAPAAGDSSRTAARRAKAASKVVNPNAYEFEEDEAPVAPRRASRSPNAAAQPLAPGTSAILSGPYRYDTRFMADNLTVGVAVDPLLGFGVTLQANLSDAFENNRFQASLFGQLDFRTSNINVSYTNITRRVDWTIAYQKQAYFFDNSLPLRYGRHSVNPTFTLPLNNVLSLRAGPRYDNLTRTTLIDQANITLYDQTRNLLGYSAELVYDNSRITGVNMLVGTRFKVGLLQMRDLRDPATNSFNKFYVDLRHYQKLHRQLVWANRVSYGQFFGPSQSGGAPQLFRLGGMDNWIGQSYADRQLLTPAAGPTPDAADLTNLFYQQFVTNLRGFDLSKRTGQRYLLLNSELRLPIVQYLSRGPVYSGFLRNLQLMAFVDAGTAYTGANPFNTENSNNTTTFGNGNPFQGTVTNFSFPLLVGYGVGVRTTILGFYTKFDLAWAREDYLSTTRPKPFLTLGHDF